MPPRNHVIVVASDSDDDPTEYSEDGSSSDGEVSVTSLSVSSVPSIAPSTASASSDSLASTEAHSSADDLHELMNELSLRGPDDQTVYSLSAPNGGNQVHLTAQEQAGYLRDTRGFHVQALQKRQKPREKADAYVVFVGRAPAVYTQWPACKAAVTRFSGAIYQGYRTIEDAHAAFDYAHNQGWTRNQPGVARPFPIPPDIDALAALRVGAITDRWYVVTVGTVPGIYRCFIQCAVSTIGVSGSVQNSYTDEMVARRAFQKAMESGCVRATGL